jgi:hypothetical protein
MYIHIYTTYIYMYIYFTKGKNEHWFFFLTKNGARWGVILRNAE